MDFSDQEFIVINYHLNLCFNISDDEIPVFNNILYQIRLAYLQLNTVGYKYTYSVEKHSNSQRSLLNYHSIQIMK